VITLALAFAITMLFSSLVLMNKSDAVQQDKPSPTPGILAPREASGPEANQSGAVYAVGIQHVNDGAY